MNAETSRQQHYEKISKNILVSNWLASEGKVANVRNHATRVLIQEECRHARFASDRSPSTWITKMSAAWTKQYQSNAPGSWPPCSLHSAKECAHTQRDLSVRRTSAQWYRPAVWNARAATDAAAVEHCPVVDHARRHQRPCQKEVTNKKHSKRKVHKNEMSTNNEDNSSNVKNYSTKEA